MNEWLIFAALVATQLSAACGSDSKGASGGTGSGGCTTPEIDGTVFGGSGPATVKATGTLPDGIADGLEAGILLAMGNESVGVLPDVSR